MTLNAQRDQNKDPKVTEVVEEYCESIHNMTLEEGKPVIAARLAERMNVSPPTVNATINRLKDHGFVMVDEKSKGIRLTELGEEVALSLSRRHRLLERLLVDVLEFDWEAAHEEACRLEHAISPSVEKALTRFLGNPKTCPHGNPIPGSGFILPEEAHPLDQTPIGVKVVLLRITEEAEHEPGLLRYLQEHHLMPGVIFTVKSSSPFRETLSAMTEEGHEVTIGIKIASKIWVTPA
ncbi:MAG: metal-dependent transcriptional regulator [Chloroflexi bacterium]|uniref:Manganese transport regulator n=1 Tax=Candidatus Chlorohelix allophototropha TaxID=3003348 RepID=A0A8T7M8Q3_9CHLR|nr:metal-dependent transcriptional regulator [Chloroflexota bacterium]WJW68266.1 metal-dependent transcriptional regulator [Chloroflexota bacterium L227-S17]